MQGIHGEGFEPAMKFFPPFWRGEGQPEVLRRKDPFPGSYQWEVNFRWGVQQVGGNDKKGRDDFPVVLSPMKYLSGSATALWPRKDSWEIK